MDGTDTDTIGPALRLVAAADGPVEVLGNNAGIGHQAKLTDVTPADYDAVFATNLRGAFFMAQACARRMIERGVEGRIINIASVAGIRPIPQLAVYGMTKAALIHMTRAMAREWARHGINVNAICPGYIETELNRDFFASPGGERLIETLPRHRLGQPDDLDGLIKLLASRESRIVNGAVITADDGYTVG
jgi:NAD(P)-dependent dehydrogenase (short-subunit alcohol dehydrogenase family)